MIDLGHVLPSVRVPTLVLHRAGDRLINVENARYVAKRIPVARYVELPGDDHLPWVGDVAGLVGEVESFVVSAAEAPDEFFAVVSEYYFTAPDVLAEHYAEVYAEFRAFYGAAPMPDGSGA